VEGSENAVDVEDEPGEGEAVLEAVDGALTEELRRTLT